MIKILLKHYIADHKIPPHHKPLMFRKSMNVYHAIIEEGTCCSNNTVNIPDEI
jgi:hypothetical protein